MLAKLAKVNVWKIYNRKKKGIGRTVSPLDLQDRTKLANTLAKELTPLFKDLGWDIYITPRKEDQQTA